MRALGMLESRHGMHSLAVEDLTGVNRGVADVVVVTALIQS